MNLKEAMKAMIDGHKVVNNSFKNKHYYYFDENKKDFMVNASHLNSDKEARFDDKQLGYSIYEEEREIVELYECINTVVFGSSIVARRTSKWLTEEEIKDNGYIKLPNARSLRFYKGTFEVAED